MSLTRTHDVATDLSVQSVNTLHIPASHAFIPFQQFSLTDQTLRNPADDNNNKTSLPVVSVVAAVSGLCPPLPVVSMQQQPQLSQAVVAQTIIPTVVAPVAMQTPTSGITMTNSISDLSHMSLHTQQHLVNAGLNLSAQIPQTNVSTPMGIINAQSIISSAGKPKTNISNVVNGANSSSSPKTSSSSSGSKPQLTTQNLTSEQADDLVKPVFKDGELVLEVECGQNKGILYLSKLCQGSKGPCISFQSSWLTPNEFQFVSGRETAKDWKRSIRHHGKSLKLLLAKGILAVHPTMCDCDGCRQGATLVSTLDLDLK